MKKDGIKLLDPRPFFGDAVPKSGCLTRRQPTKEEQEDVEKNSGACIAKEVSRLDIGQTVVVKRGTVLAVEGLEGTGRFASDAAARWQARTAARWW